MGQSVVPNAAEAGNTRAVTHGAFSATKLAPHVAELEVDIANRMMVVSEADQIPVALLARVLAKIEAVETWLADPANADIGTFKPGTARPQPILRELSLWRKEAATLAHQLGLNPTSRARLGVDLVRLADDQLKRHLDENYGGKK